MTGHQRLANLYRGRTDLWGAVHGEQVKRDLTDEDWIEHTYGEGSVGVYPIVEHLITSDPVVTSFDVAWCGVDIDEGESHYNAARNIRRVLHHFGVTSWIERSKGKGFHLLVFVDGWVEAIDARAAMLVACKAANYRPKEAYPKQVRLAEGKAGNYLNAAYAKRWADKGRRVMLDDNGDPLPLETWLDLAESQLCPPVLLHDIAAMWVEPQHRDITVGAAYQGALKALTDRLSPLAWTLFKEGPLPHKETGRIDRSGGLLRLAGLCARDGLAPHETLALVADLDARYDRPKYLGRQDAAQRYQEIVERGYA